MATVKKRSVSTKDVEGRGGRGGVAAKGQLRANIVPEKVRTNAAPSAARSGAPEPRAGKVAARSSTSKVASAGRGADAVTVGGKAPKFTLPNQHGATVSSESLCGAPYVLYFYPKDNTPGCTREACDFRDRFSAIESAGATVLGVSPDSTGSHERFVSKFELPFTLLSDGERTLAEAFGVWVKKKNYGREYMGIERSTFLVDAGGTVRSIWRNVRVAGHVDDVLGALAEMTQ